MQRIPRILVIALALGLAGVTPVQPSISIRLTRASFDLLDSIGIVVSVRNSTKVPQPVRFAHAAEYAIDVRHGADLVWTSQPTVSPAPRETTPPHTRDFPAGVTTIATFDWNELDANGMSPAPGIYTIQARLLDHAGNADAVQSIRFVEPLPLAAIAKLKVGDEADRRGHGGFVDADVIRRDGNAGALEAFDGGDGGAASRARLDWNATRRHAVSCGRALGAARPARSGCVPKPVVERNRPFAQPFEIAVVIDNLVRPRSRICRCHLCRNSRANVRFVDAISRDDARDARIFGRDDQHGFVYEVGVAGFEEERHHVHDDLPGTCILSFSSASRRTSG